MDQKDLFYDQELGSNVKAARHAVSIDERREIPVDSVMHVSVKKRFETMDYAPDQLKDWLEAHNGDWGDVEGI